MKNYQRLPKKIKIKLAEMIQNHEYHKGSYFWTVNSNAYRRRKTEQDRSMSLAFAYKGVEYSFEQDVSLSCRNYYFRPSYWVDGKKCNITALKKLYKMVGGRNEKTM